jgi:hypothetical protein
MVLHTELGHAMAQVVSRRPFTAHARVSPCGISVAQRGTEMDFLRALRFSPADIISPCLSTVIYHLGDE